MKPIIVIGKPYKWRRFRKWLRRNDYLPPLSAVLLFVLVVVGVAGAMAHKYHADTATLYNSYHYKVNEEAKCNLYNVSGISRDHSYDTVACWITAPGKNGYKGYYAKFWNPDHNTPETELFSVRDLSRK